MCVGGGGGGGRGKGLVHSLEWAESWHSLEVARCALLLERAAKGLGPAPATSQKSWFGKVSSAEVGTLKFTFKIVL